MLTTSCLPEIKQFRSEEEKGLLLLQLPISSPAQFLSDINLKFSVEVGHQVCAYAQLKIHRKSSQKIGLCYFGAVTITRHLFLYQGAYKRGISDYSLSATDP